VRRKGDGRQENGDRRRETEDVILLDKKKSNYDIG